MARRGGAFGLRGRIVGALLVTTTLTLAVAALALLGPLERKLRNQELATLKTDVSQELASFQALSPAEINQALSSDTSGAAVAAVTALKAKTGGDVTLLAYPRTLIATTDPQLLAQDDFADVPEAFTSGRAQQGFATIDSTDVARVAVPITLGSRKTATSGSAAGQTYVLAVRKSLVEVAGAVQVVRNAFITAALAGLALTLVLGIPLAATMIRSLRRLRQAAIQLAQGGPPVEIPDTRARDEVGDLTRTFKIMQRRLQQQEEARRAFVATASHELRTPLTSLDGMLELLDDDLRSGTPDIDEALGLLERARAQSRRLGRLANDLLDLSKLDAEVALRSEPVELGELSRAVLAEFDISGAERLVRPVLVDGGEQVWALADPGSVAQIVRILVDNALSFSPPHSDVEVVLSADPEGVALSVIDEGPGVPREERDVIFERFKRGATASRRGGFGLGLAIGRELAERMGGTLGLEPDPPPGARFTLRLPAARAPAEPLVPRP
jgi:signal transduction histidine kinase